MHKRGRLQAGVLLGALCVTAVAPAQTNIRNRLDDVRQALTANHPDQATTALDSILARQPDNADARFLQGLALARERQTAEAVTLFEKLTGDRPDMAAAWNNLGVLYARSGDLAGARRALNKAVNLNSDYSAAQENLGDVYVALAESAYASADTRKPGRSALELKRARLSDIVHLNPGRASSNARRSAAATPTPGATQTASHAKGSVQSQIAIRNDSSARAQGKSQSRNPHQNKHDEDNAAESSRSPTVDDPDRIKSAVRGVLQSWAEAWSDQNVAAYMNAYSDNYQPADGQSLAEWIKTRRAQLGSPKNSRISLSDIQVKPVNERTAIASFDQHKIVHGSKQNAHRTATLIREDGGWRIKRES